MTTQEILNAEEAHTVVSPSAALACAQYTPPPLSYTLIQQNSLFGLATTTIVYRDGSKAAIDIVQPGTHVRTVYDLQAHTNISWDASQAGAECGNGNFTGDWGDPFVGAACILDELNKKHPTPAGFRSSAPLPHLPLTQTVLQALLPFPQNSNKETIYGAPIGDSWYNSMQAKFTKRYSDGLSVQSAFTWSKAESTLPNSDGRGGGTTTPGNIFNRQDFKSITSFNQPLIFNVGFSYQLQKYRFLGSNKWVTESVAGWTVGGLLQYSSGLPIPTPTSSSILPGKRSIPVDPGVHRRRRFVIRMPHQGEITDGDWPRSPGTFLRIAETVAEGIELLDITEGQACLTVDPAS